MGKLQIVSYARAMRPLAALLPARPLLLVLAAVAAVVGNVVLAAPVAHAAGAATVQVVRSDGMTPAAPGTPIDVHDGDLVPVMVVVTGVHGSDDATVRIAITGCDAGTISGPQPAAGGTYALQPDVAQAWECTRLAAATGPDSTAVHVAVVDDATGADLGQGTLGITVVRPRLEVSTGLDGSTGAPRPTLTVRNAGNVELVTTATHPHCPDGFTSSDPAGLDGIVDRLQPGESATWSCAIVPGRLAPGTALAKVTASDRTGGLTTATAAVQPLPTDVAVAGASRAPVKATARLLRPVGCQRSAFLIEVSGRGIRSASLSIDGHATAFTNRAADNSAFTYVADVRTLGAGRHTLRAKVHFNGRAKAKTIVRHVRVCTRSALEVIPA
jgi:hypothetical protein